MLCSAHSGSTPCPVDVCTGLVAHYRAHRAACCRVEDTWYSVMANAVVAEWTACIKELQQIVDAAAAAQLDGGTLAQHLEKLEEHASMPHAAWKRLVQDVQVNSCMVRLDGGQHARQRPCIF